jgi:hypothetical protein
MNGLAIRSNVKAGGMSIQHNRRLKVTSAIKAGGFNLQHNRRLRVSSAVEGGGMNWLLLDRAAPRAHSVAALLEQ